MLLVETDVIVDLLRSHSPAEAWLDALNDLPAVCGLSVMEAMQGCRNAAEVRGVRELVAAFDVYWPTEQDCERALRDFAALHLSHSLGLIDSLIAATAVRLGATLVTFNVKHYRAVPDLVTEQPYTR